MNEIELNKESKAMIEAAQPLLVIKDQDDFTLANEYLQNNKRQQDKIREYFEPEIESARKTYKGLCEKRGLALLPLKQNYNAVVAAGNVYVQEQERIRKEAEAQAEEERQRKISEAQAELLKESEKAEKENDLQSAIDYIDQIHDLPEIIKPEEVKKEMRTFKGMRGTTSWINDIEVEVDETKLMQVVTGIMAGELPIECLKVSTSELKQFFNKNNVESYDKWGIKVKKITRPRNRSY